MSDDTARTIVYTGFCMSPILKAPDTLHILPYKRDKIQPGDVIVFYPPGSNNMVVHRVISADSRGVVTRGDRNRCIDPWSLRPEHIVGQVVKAQWGNRKRAIFGGLKGRLYSLVIRTICKIDSKISFLLHPIYHRVARRGILKRWVSTWMRTRIVSFRRTRGTEFQLLMGQRVIGRFLPGKNRWIIRRPFRLFVDEPSHVPADFVHSAKTNGQLCAKKIS